MSCHRVILHVGARSISFNWDILNDDRNEPQKKPKRSQVVDPVVNEARGAGCEGCGRLSGNQESL